MMINIESDTANDLLYLSFSKRALEKGSVAKTVRVTEDISVDLDSEERLLGLEIINASKRLEGDPAEVQIDSLVGVKEAAILIGVSKSNFVRDYANKAGFPSPMASIASGRIWLKSQVMQYAESKPRKTI